MRQKIRVEIDDEIVEKIIVLKNREDIEELESELAGMLSYIREYETEDGMTIMSSQIVGKD